MPKKLLQTIKNGTPANGEQTEATAVNKQKEWCQKIKMINNTHNKLVLGQDTMPIHPKQNQTRTGRSTKLVQPIQIGNCNFWQKHINGN